MRTRRLFLLGFTALATSVLTAACEAPVEDDTEGAEQLATDGAPNQGWSEQDTKTYAHAADGSSLFPAKWLLALEQATSDESFLSDANLKRYGFLLDPKSESNPAGLPVGLAMQKLAAPATPEESGMFAIGVKPGIGSNCAACHEAELTYKGQSMRIHGGQGRGELGRFFRDAYGALGATLIASQDPDPAKQAKFGRFAKAVLAGVPAEAFATAAGQLGQAMKTVLEKVQADARIKAEKGVSFDGWGPYRQDALSAGQNAITARLTPENLRPTDAPASIPHLWRTPEFDWVQYNSSLRQPMSRNVGSALMRGADVVFSTDPAKNFANTVDMKGIHESEELVSKLTAPVWPEEILGSIDRTKAKAGKAIYAKACAGCHDSPRGKDGYLAIKNVPLDKIGTDPDAATGWVERKIDLAGKVLGKDGQPDTRIVSGAEFGVYYTDGVMARNYSALGISGGAKDAMDDPFAVRTNAKPRKNLVQGKLHYRARPLDGIWATAPYLHNGSVPSLYKLLLPAKERLPAGTTSFKVGSAEMDPKEVGLVNEGSFVLDVTKPGNSNAGHEGPGYTAWPNGKAFTESERWALVEYLKTL